jgi:hypothetical protein
MCGGRKCVSLPLFQKRVLKDNTFIVNLTPPIAYTLCVRPACSRYRRYLEPREYKSLIGELMKPVLTNLATGQAKQKRHTKAT